MVRRPVDPESAPPLSPQNASTYRKQGGTHLLEGTWPPPELLPPGATHSIPNPFPPAAQFLVWTTRSLSLNPNRQSRPYNYTPPFTAISWHHLQPHIYEIRLYTIDELFRSHSAIHNSYEAYNYRCSSIVLPRLRHRSLSQQWPTTSTIFFSRLC